ncbi:MAG: DUF72 domain-containing protein [Planctomycetota bacterium]
MTLLFGVCGWDYRDWAGPLYPRPLPAGYRPLPLLARFLDFMEVNATFYRPMGGRVSVRWLEETPDTFRFVLKAWRGWTHDGEPPEGEELARFRELLDPILDRGRLEGVLAQYPPSFRDSAQGRRSITGLRDALRPAPLFVEVRHRGLYTEEFLSFLEGEDIAFVNVDLPAVGSLPRLAESPNGSP